VSGPIGAAPQAIGMACIVFVGNVRGDHALAQVVAILNKSSRTRDTPGTAARQRPARHDA
jgi:hypothetical protein